MKIVIGSILLPVVGLGISGSGIWLNSIDAVLKSTWGAPFAVVWLMVIILLAKKLYTYDDGAKLAFVMTSGILLISFSGCILL